MKAKIIYQGHTVPKVQEKCVLVTLDPKIGVKLFGQPFGLMYYPLIIDDSSSRWDSLASQMILKEGIENNDIVYILLKMVSDDVDMIPQKLLDKANKLYKETLEAYERYLEETRLEEKKIQNLKHYYEVYLERNSYYNGFREALIILEEK
jgi:hypothetical protein